MNLLYVAVDPSLYTYYSAGKAYTHAVYPFPFPDNINEVLDFTTCTNDNERAAANIMHAILFKMQSNVVNMNAALVNTLLSLILMAFKLLYEQEWMMNSNAVFQ
jgi:hypothetical protein